MLNVKYDYLQTQIFNTLLALKLNLQVCYRVRRKLPMIPAQSQINPEHTLTFSSSGTIVKPYNSPLFWFSSKNTSAIIAFPIRYTQVS